MKFSKFFLQNWRFWKMYFFWVGHFEFFFQKKKIFFCWILTKTRESLLASKEFPKFWWLPWFAAHEVLGQHLCTGLYPKCLIKFWPNFSAQAQKFWFFEKKLSLDVRSPWFYTKLWNQVPSLDHFVVQNSGDFLCWTEKSTVNQCRADYCLKFET